MRRLFFTLTTLALSGLTILAAAQDTCPAFVEAAIEAASENCTDIGRNEACYGYRAISAAFYEDAVVTFEQPTDRVPISNLRRIESLPPDPDAGEVGVALMKLQAMLPNTLPGQNVVFVLVGDVQVESAVDPDEAASPAEAITVETTAEADAHSGPSEDYNALVTFEAGAEVQVDGTSEDGAWYRVVLDEEDLLVWLPADALPASDELAALPVVTGGAYGPMQAFTLTTGVGQPGCEEAPNALMVQGPETTEITLNVNGADITVGSTVVFEATDEDELEVAVIDGAARLGDNQIVLGGFRARIGLDPRTRRVTGDWQPTEELPDKRLAQVQRYAGLRPGPLNYGITPPTREDIRARVEAGLLDRQNNFGALSPEQRREIIPFESKLQDRIRDINRPGVRVRPGIRIGGMRDGDVGPLGNRDGEGNGLRGGDGNGPLGGNRGDDGDAETGARPGLNLDGRLTGGEPLQPDPSAQPPDSNRNGEGDGAAAPPPDGNQGGEGGSAPPPDRGSDGDNGGDRGSAPPPDRGSDGDRGSAPPPDRGGDGDNGGDRGSAPPPPGR